MKKIYRELKSDYILFRWGFAHLVTAVWKNVTKYCINKCTKYIDTHDVYTYDTTVAAKLLARSKWTNNKFKHSVNSCKAWGEKYYVITGEK